MLRFKILGGATILLVLLIIGVAWFTGSTNAVSVKSPPPPPPPLQRPFQQSYVSGNPAIHPHASSTNVSGYAFSRSDVIAFLNKYGFYSGPLAPGAHLKILTVQFVTSKQASALMYGESVGRPDDYPVCYIKVEGPFLLTYVHGGAYPRGSTRPKLPTTAKYGDAVFDGHTGNLLVWGIYFQ
jgi:hypothetical protein